MTHPVDPWASTDHDPSSSTADMTNSGEIHTATQTLAFARADIHTAVGAHDDAHRRRQYAQSALSYANTVPWPRRHRRAAPVRRLLPGGRAGDDRRRVSRQPPPAGARPPGAAPGRLACAVCNGPLPRRRDSPRRPSSAGRAPATLGAQSLSHCPY
jgi:hypothetical protein